MKLIIPILVATLLVGVAVGGGAGYVVGDRQGGSAPVVAVPTVGPVPGSCDWVRWNCPNVPACADSTSHYLYMIRQGCAVPP